MGALVAIMLAACGGGNNADNGGEAVSAEEKILRRNCISCHGDQLQGRNGPRLTDVGDRLSEEEILNVIQKGAPGMPGNLIKGEEAERVAKWLSEQKGE